LLVRSAHVHFDGCVEIALADCVHKLAGIGHHLRSGGERFRSRRANWDQCVDQIGPGDDKLERYPSAEREPASAARRISSRSGSAATSRA
jgi:hypothetical protein